MYKHILLPTDGSQLSRDAVVSGLRFAKQLNAIVTGIHVVPSPHADSLEAWLHRDPHYPEQRQALFEKFADECLSYVSASALAEQVTCTCRKVIAHEPYHAIIQTAELLHCDMIYMASHGWKGANAQFLGSETLKVLHHSPIPVFVYKPARTAAGKSETPRQAG